MTKQARVAVAVAPNGGRRTKADHPAIPLTPAELGETAAAARDAGAAMIHVHVRKPDGSHLLDADAYADAIAAIHAAVGDALVIQMTSEALGVYAPPEQIAVVKAVRPEAVSLALRELCPTAAEEAAFAEFLAWLKANAVVPQFIVYAADEFARLNALIRRGLVPWADPPVLFVLGRYTAGQTSLPADLLPFLAPTLRRPSHWMTCAFGRFETACATAAALMGGHVRVGFENNLDLPDGGRAADNAASVSATVAALNACGLRPANAAELRAAWAEACREATQPGR
jgi:uncharacterized protein (DUF849 family)